ncbi:MAG: hypothetical protein B6U85_06825 [Desulfurococcales archaeon ex4484_42]|nr:MAG: hypothetical protein B6U85_06825 [Desulfurococcales archaeon ex4484_42]
MSESIESIEEFTEAHVVRVVTECIEQEATRIAKLVESSLRERDKKSLRDLIGNERIRKVSLNPRLKNLCSVAVDTSFTTPPLELTGGKLVLIVRGHVLYGNCSAACIPRSDAKGYVKFIQESEGIATPLSKIIERKFIIELLEKKLEHKAFFDLIILDGELFPRVPPGFIKRSKESVSLRIKLYGRLIELTSKMLRLADKTDTALVGILKRAYGSDLAIILRKPNIRLNDKVLASYVLSNGEYIVLGSYADLYDDLLRLVKDESIDIPASLRRTLNEKASWLRASIRYVDHVDSINLVLYKGITPSYFTLATKAEVYVSSILMLDDIVSYLSMTTGVNGVPYPVDVVDSLCRITSNLLFNAQQQLFKELSERLGDSKLAMAIAGLTNPEKMYKIGIK